MGWNNYLDVISRRWWILLLIQMIDLCIFFRSPVLSSRNFSSQPIFFSFFAYPSAPLNPNIYIYIYISSRSIFVLPSRRSSNLVLSNGISNSCPSVRGSSII